MGLSYGYPDSRISCSRFKPRWHSQLINGWAISKAPPHLLGIEDFHDLANTNLAFGKEVQNSQPRLVTQCLEQFNGSLHPASPLHSSPRRSLLLHSSGFQGIHIDFSSQLLHLGRMGAIRASILPVESPPKPTRSQTKVFATEWSASATRSTLLSLAATMHGDAHWDAFGNHSGNAPRHRASHGLRNHLGTHDCFGARDRLHDSVRHLPHATLLDHSANSISARSHALFGHHAANLIATCFDATLRHHAANAITTRLYTTLRHHATDSIGARLDALLRDHPAHLVGACLDARLANHPANSIGACLHSLFGLN